MVYIRKFQKEMGNILDFLKFWIDIFIVKKIDLQVGYW